jgi:large subunit ribosomal protein L10
MGTNTMRIAEKERVVEELAGRVRDAKCLYVTDFTGLGVGAMTELRRRLAEAQVEYIVVKNTLARRALAGGDFEELTAHLEGPSAFAVSHSDAVVAAKILTEFARDREKPKIKAGLIEGKVVSMDDIRRLAALPPREVLLAQLMASVRAPIAGLVYTLHGLLAKFVRTVDAMRAQREAEGGAGASQPEIAAPEPDDPSSVESEA